MEFKKSYLIQRLRKPHESCEVFSFGGGLVNGGLSPDAMKLIRPLCSFDYMGASEFEWGAVPNALKKLVGLIDEGDPLASKTISIWPKQIEKSNHYKIGADKVRRGVFKIHVVYVKTMLDKAAIRVRALAEDESKFTLCERPGIGSRVLWTRESDDVIGWLELENGWLATVSDRLRDGWMDLFKKAE